MEKTNFIISFAGLKKGTHYFDFEINNSFFDLFEHSVVTKGSLNVRTELVKSTNLLILDIRIKGKVEVECDRCLDRFFTPINYFGRLYVKISDSLVSENNVEETDMLILSTNNHEIDISQYLYECIVLSLPLKKIHPVSGKEDNLCNQKMLNFLKEHIENKKQADPRWDELKNLLENKK